MATLKCVDCLTDFDGEWDYYFAPDCGRCPTCEAAREAYGRQQAEDVRAAVSSQRAAREGWMEPGETPEEARARKLDR